MLEEMTPQQVSIANPAAVYCAQIGGVYDLVAGTCTIGGVAYDAWNLYYAAQGQVSASSIDFNSILSPMVSIMVIGMMFGMMKSVMQPESGKGMIRTAASGYKSAIKSIY